MSLVSRFRRRSRDSDGATVAPRLSFGSWETLEAPVVAVCHPAWRGVRSATYGHGGPVIEVADAAVWADELVRRLADAHVRTLVVQGFPPGSETLLRRAHAAGMATRVVLHSSMAQHGGEAAEAAVADLVLRLQREGVVDRVGFVKEGLAEAFGRLGYEVAWVPNRIPTLPESGRWDLGAGTHVGVFAEPFWRKNVVTQLGAVALIPHAVAHVIRRPDITYLERLPMQEHGLLPWEEFVALAGSVDVNLYVTLSECYPLSPIESYLTGVPALMSRTSSVFRDDPELWDLTTVDELDNPRAIAVAAMRLLDARADAVVRARAWAARWDDTARILWDEYLRG